MILHSAQIQIAQDIHRFRVVNCGRRFGKTVLAIEEIKGLMLADRNDYINKLNIDLDEKNKILHISNEDNYRIRVNYFAETNDDVRELVWQPLLRELKPIIIKKNEQLSEIICRNKDREKTFLKLRSWENVELMRGKKSDINIYDEVAKYRKFWLYKEEVLRPTISDYIGRELYMSTPRGFNHFYDLYNLEQVDKDYKSFHFTSYDNPYLSRSELEKAKKELTEDRFAQEYLADFRKTEGLVFTEFDRDRHLFDEPGLEGKIYNAIKIFGGHDFGTRNPCASIEIQKDREEHYWVFEKLYKTGMTESEQAEYVAGLKWHMAYPDPESLSGRLEMKQKGVNVREVVKNKTSIKDAINIIQELFKQGRLHIHREAVNLIWEFETNHYPDKKDDRNPDENPVDENNHGTRALGYALMMEVNDKPSIVTVHRPANIGYHSTINNLPNKEKNFRVIRPARSINRWR